MSLEVRVIDWLARQDGEVYLVGGCVRDRLLGRSVYDVDVAVAGDGLLLARRLANHFGGAYYPLDAARSTGRAVFTEERGRRVVVDVARFRGADLAADLADRDFTINALAADVRIPSEVIDYHGGLSDLRSGLIRPVSEACIRDDPLRALRAVRQAAELEFALTSEAEALIRRDGSALVRISGERVRDELARLLEAEASARHLAYMDELGLLTVVLPELEPLRGLVQPPPHYLDALAHSLQTVRDLEESLVALSVTGAQRGADPLHPCSDRELAALRPFAGQLSTHLNMRMGETRPRQVTLKLAALLHDVGKPGARTVDDEGRIRFIEHPKRGASTAALALQRLRFNRREVRLGETIVRHHMRPLLLAGQERVTSRAIYRFFRDTSEAGVDILLHALADHRATYPAEGDDDRWSRLVALTAHMLAEYWERQAAPVAAPSLLNGDDLIREFGLQPGPRLGALLEAVREAQIVGEVRSREEAFALVRDLLNVQDTGPSV
jgi:poly(A) polymerase